MKEAIIKNLNQIISFWKDAIDEKGGFYCVIDSKCKKDVTADRGVLHNSRILYFFSYASKHDSSCLPYATHAYRWLKQYCYDHENGGVYWNVHHDGSPCEAVKHVYNQAFAIYALSAYYSVSKDEEALKLALEIFELVEKHAFDQNGYKEEFTSDWKLKDNSKLSDGNEGAEKTMNTLLHLIEAYTELYMVYKNERVKEKIIFLLTVFKDSVYNKSTKSLMLYFNNAMQSIQVGRSYGHDIEASWLLERACDAVEQSELTKQVRAINSQLAQSVLDEGTDEKGFVYNENVHGEDKNVIWWVQAESVIGYLNEYQKSNNTIFFDAAQKTWEYINNKLISPCGEWYGYFSEESGINENGLFSDPWKGPYHNGRMCFEAINRLK